MTETEKRYAIIGGIAAVGVIAWALLQRSGGAITTGDTINLGGAAGPSYSIGGDTNSLNLPSPGNVTFQFAGSPGQSPPPCGCVPSCNCPDVQTYYGDTTDQAGAISQPSIQSLLTDLGTALNNILPPGGYGDGTVTQNRVAAYKAQKALYSTPVGDINAAFAAMQLG
ncbi:MAG TPA: hypothetical protein VGF36_07235 [Rhodopila sp.]